MNADGKAEIITGGAYRDGSHWVAQLSIWSGSSLNLKDTPTWDWGSDTWISSVALGDVDGDGKIEIITSGYYFDGTRDVAQLCVWSGTTLALENIRTWYWVDDTYGGGVAVGDVYDDGKLEIVTGGSYHNGIGYAAQLCVLNGATLGLEDVTAWFWPNHTTINSVAVRDVDNDCKKEIIKGGLYAPSSYWVAQLCVWG